MTGDRERCLGGRLRRLPVQADPAPPTLRGGPGPARRRPGRPRRPAPAGPRPAAPAFDRDAALEDLGGDEELLDEVLGLFLDDCPAAPGRDPGRRSRPATPPTLERLAHTVAGVGRQLRRPLVAAARRLEAGQGRLTAGAEDDRGRARPRLDRFRDSARRPEAGISDAASPG